MIVFYIRSEAKTELTRDRDGVRVHPARAMSFSDHVRLFLRGVLVLPAAAAWLPPHAPPRVRHFRRHDSQWTGLGTVLAFVKSKASKIFRKPTRIAKREETNNRKAAVSGGNAPAPNSEEYKVFLSFRGPGTCTGFTDCLHCDMLGAGIHFYEDDKELHVGREIGGELILALDVFKVYVHIFSMDYALSSWCLHELTHMLDYIVWSEGNVRYLS